MLTRLLDAPIDADTHRDVSEAAKRSRTRSRDYLCRSAGCIWAQKIALQNPE
jgi:hypothetical protein